MKKETHRWGNFSSSSIYKLMGAPAARETYVREKIFERKLHREINIDRTGRAALWGELVQNYVLENLLPITAIGTLDERRSNDAISCWTGAEDYLTPDGIGEIKCFELKKFCQVHEAATEGYEVMKEEYPEIFWQIISNCILNGVKKCELVLFIPSLNQLQEIREMDIDDEPQYSFIKYCRDDELPYMPDDSEYSNLNIFSFDIKEEDIIALTEKVKHYAEIILKPKTINNK